MICVSVLDGGTHATRPSNARVAHSFPVAFSVYSYFLIVVTHNRPCATVEVTWSRHTRKGDRRHLRHTASSPWGGPGVRRVGASPPCTVRTQGIFAWPPRKNVLDVRCASVRCGLCMWVSVLQWRKVPLPFSVSLDGRLYMCFALRVACGRTAPQVCSGTNRKTASLSAVRCAAGMLWCTPENRVSLGGTLRRRYAMVRTVKHRHEALACVGVRRNTSGCSCRGS